MKTLASHALPALLLLGLAPQLAGQGRSLGSPSAPGAPHAVPIQIPTGLPFYVTFNDRVLSGSGGGPGLVLNGDVTFGLPRVDLAVGSNSLCRFEMKAALALDLVASGDGTFQKTLSLGYVPIAALYTSALPVTGWIVLTADLTIQGTFEAGMEVGMVGQLELGGIVDYAGLASGAGDPSDVVFELSTPELTGASGLSVEVAVEGGAFVVLAAAGIPIGGPYLKARSGVRLGVDPGGNPWWEAEAFIGTAAGWDLVGIPGGSALYGPETAWQIADAGGPLSAPSAPTRWSRSYDLGIAEGIEALAPLAPQDGGGFVAVANLGSASNQPWLAGLDDDGALSWQQEARASVLGNSRPTSVVALSGGGFALGGTRGANGSRVDVFDPVGVPLWTVGYLDGGGETLDLCELIETADGGLAFAGTVRRGLEKHPVVVRLDASGAVVWASELRLDEAQGITACEIADLIETADGHLVLCGQANYADGPGTTWTIGGQNALVASFEAGGTLAWGRFYGGTGWDDATALCELDSGDLLFVGKVANEASSMWVARVEPDGTLVASAVIDGEDGVSTDGATAVAAVEGGALVAGVTRIGTDSDALLARVDDEGDVIWMKSIRGSDLDELVGLEAREDGFIAWGRTQSTQPSGLDDDMWIVRGPNDGMLHFDPAGSFWVRNDRRERSTTGAVVQLELPCEPMGLTVLQDATALAFDPALASETLLTR